jgi:hypothetical protein
MVFDTDADAPGIKAFRGDLPGAVFLRMRCGWAPILFGYDEFDGLVAFALGRIVSITDADQPLSVFCSQLFVPRSPGRRTVRISMALPRFIFVA